MIKFELYLNTYFNIYQAIYTQNSLKVNWQNKPQYLVFDCRK